MSLFKTKRRGKKKTLDNVIASKNHGKEQKSPRQNGKWKVQNVGEAGTTEKEFAVSNKFNSSFAHLFLFFFFDYKFCCVWCGVVTCGVLDVQNGFKVSVTMIVVLAASDDKRIVYWTGVVTDDGVFGRVQHGSVQASIFIWEFG